MDFFTNHSLRCTGGTCLFQAGVGCKLVKEATGHRSDVIDTYQITSDEQREVMSKILPNIYVKQLVRIQKVQLKRGLIVETVTSL